MSHFNKPLDLNWFDKIKSLTRKDDNSPELKKGEIKSILLNQANVDSPDFFYTTFKNGCYTFQRLRLYNELTVYETLHIAFGLKDRNFSCSVASRLNPFYIDSNSYNGGLINPHVDLIALKTSKGGIPIEEAYYFHNGRINTTTRIVKQIFGDFTSFGIQFFDRHFQRLNNNQIVNAGLENIKILQYDRARLQSEINTQLKTGGQLISSIKHPVYIQLKENLQSIPAQTREDRQEIPRLAYELLELYWSTKKNGT